MNETEHLLTCLLEECGEVQHAVAKALRFGLEDARDGKVIDNATYTSMELIDVIAVRELLVERGILPAHDARVFEELLATKKAKVLKHMELARQKGTIT